MNPLSDKSNLRQLAIISAMLVIGVLLFLSLETFVSSVLGAIMFFVLFRPMMINLSEKRKWKKTWATVVILFISFLVFLLPLAAVTLMVMQEVGQIQGAQDEYINKIKDFDKQLRDNYGIGIMSPESLESMKSTVLQRFSGAVNQSVTILAQICLMYFILYYMLFNHKELADFAWKYLPFKKKSNTKIFIEELKSQTFGNALAVPILAISQGVIAALGYWVFQLPDPWFWGIITGIFTIIPVIGTAAIWIPCGLFLLLNQQWWQGLSLLAYGGVVIGNIDNVLRFILQKRFADVHPLITVFGVIAGLALFGLPGLIFGPLLISYFLILIKVYRSEYLDGEGDATEDVELIHTPSSDEPTPLRVDGNPTGIPWKSGTTPSEMD